MRKNEFLAETLVWIHFLIMILFGLIPFFISTKVWPERPLWHFLFMFTVAMLGIILAIIYRKKFHIKKAHVCFLNMITQKVRGYKYTDPKNYTFSTMKEVFKKFGINFSPLLSWISLIIATILTTVNLIIYLS